MDRTENSKRNIKIFCMITALILIAELCRHQKHFGLGNEYNMILKPVRVTIYLGLFIAWGISVSKRIVNRQLKTYLVLIDCLIVFWFSVTAVRQYFLIHQGVISRTIWYGCYIPIIMIPTFMLFAAMYTRKGEDYRLPKSSWAVTAVSVAFSAVIASNDFHYKVFRPKGTIDMLESWYSHTVIYWLAVGWIVLLTVGAVVIISMRCRQPHSRRIAVLPIFIFLIVGAYFAFMMIDYRSWKWVFGDYTPFLCVSVIAILESCIQSGMIPSNTGYEELFRSSPVGMLILDDELNICYKTAQAEDIPRPDLIAAAEGKTQYGRNMVLQKYPLRAGYAVWEEDVTELADIIEDLENNRREIAEGNYLAEHSYRTVSRLRHTQEQNRLYDTLQKQTASQNRKMHELLRRYDSPASESERRKVLAESAVIAAYIKRKGNLIFHGEKSGIIPTEELRMCIEESMNNIRLLGIECWSDIRIPGGIRVDSAIRIYDLFEQTVESVLDEATLIFIKIGNHDAVIRVIIECELGDGSPEPVRVATEIDDLDEGGTVV